LDAVKVAKAANIPLTKTRNLHETAVTKVMVPNGYESFIKSLFFSLFYFC
jgi:hypothetical protein